MDSRAENILKCIVRQYVETAEPVGSRVLSKLVKTKMSAATIRNVMADLAEAGFITQPHTSAGRIPTDLGYRYFVDQMMEKVSASQWVPNATKEKESAPQQLEEILMSASRELSKRTQYTGVVISPQPAASRLKRVELIPLSTTQLLVVVVTQSGMVRNKIVSLRETPNEEVLNEISHAINSSFMGQTIATIRENLVDELSSREYSHHEFLPNLIRLGKKIFDVEEMGDLFISGRSNMCSYPEFRDKEELEIVFRAFDDKASLVKILTNAMQSKGIKILIGSEIQSQKLEQCSVVVASYGNRDSLLGSIGVVGPTRMNYAETISVIDRSSKKLTYEVSQFLD